jgi:hypothetical protein
MLSVALSSRFMDQENQNMVEVWFAAVEVDTVGCRPILLSLPDELI